MKSMNILYSGSEAASTSPLSARMLPRVGGTSTLFLTNRLLTDIQ